MKKVLNAIWNEFIYGGHLAAIGPVVMALIASRTLRFSYSIPLLITVYCITYVAYTFDRLLDLNKEDNNRSEHLRTTSNTTRIIIFVYSLTSIILGILTDHRALIVILLLLGISFSYTLIFKRLTKTIIGFKSFFVSISYSATLLLVSYFHNAEISPVLLTLILFFIFRVLANTIFCDIKDIAVDRIRHLKTIPVVMSLTTTYSILILVNIISAIPVILGVTSGIMPSFSLLLLLTIPYSIYYYYLSSRPRADFNYLANFWADGELILWLIIFTGGLLWR